MGLVLFGLTGGLGSGKSTVAARFRAQGLPVIDADALARDVVAKGTEGLAEVVRAFGPEVLAPDGSLDRARVAAIVFDDPDKRRRLNAIVHPRIGALLLERAAEIEARGEPLACYEAALLVENGLADAFRPLVVVAVPEAVQIARAMARDGATEEQVRARLAAQLPLADKVAVADHVIDNAGDRAATERQADEVLAAIRAKLGRAGPLT
ncbi:dephospho-CoA kinase [Sorangium cellulosum]|uniref:Dephospho-CoA kinase n=1 Tax=Sorangium cellulosum TaxID=56 RepID=A0A150T691_SORCE|nr:dephospho-CoA kinase [Sorangium cellulosum]KYG02558.1 dephospho-CoA kinase [Sorangium cellulosum]